MLGAVASSAGDAFHELWAAREVLRLLDADAAVVGVTVEGVPADEAHATIGPNAQAADITLSRRDGTFEYLQLKYSPSHPDQRWTWARLLAPVAARRPGTSVLGKLGRLFDAAPSGSRIGIVTNQPLDQQVATDIGYIGQGASGLDTATAKKLKKETGLNGPDLDRFLLAWDLSGFGAATRLELETGVLQRFTALSDADARDDAAVLQHRVAAYILPENRGRPAITRETLLVWLGAGSEEQLHPAPSRIQPPTPYYRRDRVDQVTTALEQATLPVRLHGQGGCGKTSLAVMLASDLPPGSELFIYDCYGGGLFLASDQRRHLPGQAFAQLGNEIAARLRTPFVIRPTEGVDALRAFRRRVTIAAGLVAQRSPDARLVVCFDAVDNARIAARHWREPCFLDEIAMASGWPPNVRILVTCRTARLDEVGPAKLYHNVEAPPFDADEVFGMVTLSRPHWTRATTDAMHDLTGGVPRRIAYAVAGAPADREDMVLGLLMPRATGLDPLFDKLVTDAGVRLGDPDRAWTLLGALARMPRPVPGWALTEVCGLRQDDVADIANDIGGIVEHHSGWSFADEDFEAFADERTRHLAPALLKRAADLLLDRRQLDAYAARSVGEALMAAGRMQELYDLAQAVQEPSPLSNMDRRTVADRRVKLALRCCDKAADLPTACRLLAASAEAAKRDGLMSSLLANNLDLAARFSPEAAMRQVLTGSGHRKLRARLRIELAATADDEAVRRDNFRWWLAELADRDGEAGKTVVVSACDIATEYEVLVHLRDREFAFERVTGWRPSRMLVDVFSRLAARSAGRDPDALLDAIAARLWPPAALAPMLGAALLAGASFADPVARDALNRLARATPARWPRQHESDPVRRTALEAEEAALSACELALPDLSLHPVISRLLDNAFPKPIMDTTGALHRLSSSASSHARVLALREAISGVEARLADWLPPTRAVPRVEVDKRRRWMARREKTEEELWNEAVGSASATVKPLLEAARLMLRPDAGMDSADRMTKIAGVLRRAEHVEQRNRDAAATHRLVRSWLLRLAATGEDVGPLINATMRLLGSEKNADPRWTVDLAKALGLCPHAHDAAITVLMAASKHAHELAAPASERANRLAAIARAALPLDEHLARSMFDAAAEAIDLVDMEALNALDLCVTTAIGGVDGERDELATLAERLADLAGSVDATLGLGREFDWSGTVRAMAALDQPTALAAAARWHDRGLVDYEATLPALLDGVSLRAVSPLQRYALSLLVTDERPLLDQLLHDGETMPAVAVNAELRDSLQRSDEDRLRATLDIAGTTRSPVVSLTRDTLRTLDGWRPVPSGQQVERAGTPQEFGSEDEFRAAFAAVANGDRSRADQYRAVAARIIKPRLRAPFLRQARALAGRDGQFGMVLVELLDKWRDYPPVADWIRAELPDYIVGALTELFGYSWEQTDTLENLLDATGLAGAGQAELVLRGIVEAPSPPGPEMIFSLTGIIAERLEPTARRSLLDHLMSNTAARTNRPTPVMLVGNNAPADVDQCVARLLFAAMADVDKRLRWRASHAALMLLRADDPAIAELISRLAHDDEPVFSAGPFYVHAAREQVMAVLLRGAVDRPDVVARHVAAILALLRRDPHAIVRELGRATLLLLADGGQVTLSAQDQQFVRGLNRSTLPPAPKNPLAARPGGFHDEEKERSFDFDTMDTTRYWYATPARLFGMTMPDFLDEVEKWIHGRWGFGGADITRWTMEPRLERLRDVDGLTSNRHGGQPTVERLTHYLEWHGMMCAVGELLQTRPLMRTEPHNRSMNDWLAEHLPTQTPRWASDLKTPPPLERLFHGYAPNGMAPSSGERDANARWLARIPEESFDEVLRATHGSHDLVVAGDHTSDWRSRLQEATIRSALVTPETAWALGHALSTARDRMAWILPGADDDRECDEESYTLRGWLHDDEREPRSDRADPRRGTVSRIPAAPDQALAKALGLRFDHDLPGWCSATGEPALTFRNWGEHGEEVGGWRLEASAKLIMELLSREKLDMIVSVEIKRWLRQDEDRKGRTSWRLFIQRADGHLEPVMRQRRHLGPWLVRRAGMVDSTDTLGRWMLHRAGELDQQRASAIGKARQQFDQPIDEICAAFKIRRQSGRFW